jgi:hypothetical protein
MNSRTRRGVKARKAPPYTRRRRLLASREIIMLDFAYMQAKNVLMAA